MGFHLNKFILPAMSLRWVIQVIIQMPLNTLATLYKIVNNNFWVPYGAINTLRPLACFLPKKPMEIHKFPDYQ